MLAGVVDARHGSDGAPAHSSQRGLHRGLLARKVAKRRAFALEALRVRTIDLVRAQTEFIVAGSLGLQQGKALDAAQRVAEATYRLQVLQLVADVVLSLMSATCLGAVFLLAASHFHRGDIDAPRLVLLVLVTLVAVECLGPLRRGVLEFQPDRVGCKAGGAHPQVAFRGGWTNAGAHAPDRTPFGCGAPRRTQERTVVATHNAVRRARSAGGDHRGERLRKSTLLALAAGVI